MTPVLKGIFIFSSGVKYQDHLPKPEYPMYHSFEGQIPIEPVAKGRPRLARTGHVFTPQKTRIYEAQLKLYLMALGPKIAHGALSLNICFWLTKPKSAKKLEVWPVKKPDIDNLLKAFKDAGNGILYVDDSQIVEVYAVKRYAEIGYIDFSLRSLLTV